MGHGTESPFAIRQHGRRQGGCSPAGRGSPVGARRGGATRRGATGGDGTACPDRDAADGLPADAGGDSSQEGQALQGRRCGAPGSEKLKVWRQKLVGADWKTVERTRTNAKGRYRFVVKDAGRKAAGTFRILVVKKNEVAGVSPEFAVTIKARR